VPKPAKADLGRREHESITPGGAVVHPAYLLASRKAWGGTAASLGISSRLERWCRQLEAACGWSVAHQPDAQI